MAMAMATEEQLTAVDVLVVDDDQAIRAVLRAVLDEAGYTVYDAPDGRPALHRLQTHPQGMVVLLDLNMPGVDGLAVLTAVAGDSRLAMRHRIILITAQPSRTLPLAHAQLIAQHATAVLPKPFDLEDLLQTVAEAAQRLR